MTKNTHTLLTFLFFIIFMTHFSCSSQKNELISATQTDSLMTDSNSTQIALFGGGCFWCTEAIFLRLKGVISVQSGYAGGQTENPSYKDICTGTTGHAEVISIKYDPTKISFIELLKVFFATHDPTTLNRQGADVGTQYRSVVFAQDEKQKEETELVIQELTKNNVYPSAIVTQIEPNATFYIAEDYHQNYYNLNTNQGYCRTVITPKIEKFEKTFSDLLR
jgi:peptide-methionine (S)-S-oxide reductase